MMTYQKIFQNRAYIAYFILFWLATLTVFIWLININLLTYVIGSNDFTGPAKISFIAGSYLNYFRYFTNPVAFSSIIFSLLVAFNFTLILYLSKEARQKAGSARNNAGAFGAMIGSHCVSCGTSLVAPVITALAGSGAFFSAQRATTGLLVATAANLLGVLLVCLSIAKVTKRIRRLNV